mmetsp:Transcript_67/g.226  ORF Transcript_67/g.226 Transcript_67/m.226 type:complete len:305 (-) Transcript_67:3280-4194(-)|eukprot:CAMPEP_0171585852 /NCGR_PEP_ID=MMETSP0961-20121227/12246_1 /TAXON_ID=87120 /ORGANISM="Aurantiochytrium limacinum, Strain ATCCMYA-1381" /LENGTH=304 /DNA_ID=CAMNT_0012143531 /DNA_START=485 /DNA_END=1399 /DNA_ORIENTATION=+
MLATVSTSPRRNEAHASDMVSALTRWASERHKRASLGLMGIDDTLQALIVASQRGYLGTLQRLCQSHPDLINKQDNLGWTALMHAADKGQLASIQCLLQQTSIDVNISSTVGGATALMLACSRGHAQIVESLVQHDSLEVNQANEQGWTPLMLASFENHRSCAFALLSHPRINCTFQNRMGLTSLLMACMRCNREIIQAHLAKSSLLRLQPSWFPNGQSVSQLRILQNWTMQNSTVALQVFARLSDEGFPCGLSAYITTLALGNELITFGPFRGNLLQIARLVILLSTQKPSFKGKACGVLSPL